MSPVRWRGRRRLASATALTVIAALAVGVPMTASGAPADQAGPTAQLWDRMTGPLAAARAGHEAAIDVDALRAFSLDRAGMASALRGAPQEFTRAASSDPLELSVPAPGGGFQRFEVQESPVMEPGLAALHPDIATYSGSGIDDPTSTIRLDLTPLGFHASVRGALGSWYVDPYYHLDQSIYASYFARDLEDIHGTFVERGLKALERDAQQLEASNALEAEAFAPTGDQLRTYRLALVTDPGYAEYFDFESDPANVTAAKVTLINRVTQIYEDETAIRMVLVANNDLLNLNTAADATGANGPCGSAPCYTPATQLDTCSGGLLNRNRIVIGQIIGAGNYDIGHVALGKPGGGVAGLGVVGRDGKARGCTGLAEPVGDFFAVDYVAHEMGHQFAGNHSFNGNQHNCTTNRAGSASVEPGSGSSIMAYAGICRQDDLQPHSDPYWSQRSFTEITTYVTSSQAAIDEVQNVALRNFSGTESFKLTYNAGESADIVRGSNYTTAGIKAAIEAIPTWPPGGTVTVAGFASSGTLDDTGFQVTFGATLDSTDALPLGVVPVSGDVTGFSGETATGGAVDNQGFTVEATGNAAPVVTAPAAEIIPYRTPFELTGSAMDADGDTLTYLWEQNNQGGVTGTALTDPVKTNGPLFRQFGTPLQQPPYDPTEYEADGENHPTIDPTRVFPDMAQILANNTNADTGLCPGYPPPPPPQSGGTNVPQPLIDCSSEFLPTPVYAGPMSFRLTARDGNPGGGGVNSADVTVSLAPGTGPFRVTAPNTAVSYDPGSTQTVTWDVAGTNLPPIGTANVDITLSTDGGTTFPHDLATATPNDGSQQVTLPAAGTTEARIKIKASDNVFFDVSNSDFTIGDPPVVTDDAPSDLAVPHGEALPTTVTISATDPDSEGADLAATPSGLPDGMSLVVASTSAPSALPGTRSWTVAGTANDTPGLYEVTVEVSDGGLTDSTDFTIQVTDPQPTDLSVTSSASAPSVEVGRAVSYTVVVRNNGPSSAAGVELGQTAPSDAIVLLAGPSRADDCSRSGGGLTCDVGIVPSGSSATVGFTLVPTQRGPFSANATVSAINDDTDGSNDTATVATQATRAKCTIKGTPQKDKLKGTRGRDVICARGGADTIRSRRGDDIVIGGGGNDTMKGGAGIDVISGRGGRDAINVGDGVAGNDAALGDGGSDTCTSDPADVVVSCP